jgi:G8 domain
MRLRHKRILAAALGVIGVTGVVVVILLTNKKTAREQEAAATNSPFVLSGYSERIKVLQPPKPAVWQQSSRTNCPHLQSGLSDWHQPRTWPNLRIPRAGDNVTLPSNRKVVIRKSILRTLGTVTIPPTTTLIIGEAANGILIDANGFDVKGSLVAGSDTCLIQTPVAITLHGKRPANAVQTRPTETYKGISVTGTLDLHGKRYYRSWTRLAKSVNPGDKVLFLQDFVNWQVGQRIVLVSTALKDSREWHQNEVLLIAKVDTQPVANVGASVTVSTAIKYKHIANSGYQAEVGLLSRTIKIQGSATDSEPTDKDPLTCMVPVGEERYGDTRMPCGYTEITGFGGHVMIHGKGRGYVEGVEFYRMGQTNVLGRYPIHFHLLGNCPSCYVSASSFYHSFYRCVAIHGTNQALVTENVAYDVTGYCYYLEDGVEENNTLSFNLAAHIHAIGPKPPNGMGSQEIDPIAQNLRLTLPADVTASGFYITNVRNNIIGNAASGVSATDCIAAMCAVYSFVRDNLPTPFFFVMKGWAGFAFPLLRTPLNTFRNQKFRPSSAPGLVIDGNSVHSSGWWWGHGAGFYFGGDLYYNDKNVLEYNPGRSGDRSPCRVNACVLGDCDYGCPIDDQVFIRVSNSKAFRIAGVGMGSWTGGLEVLGWESHDVGLAIESLSSAGFWIDSALIVCRYVLGAIARFPGHNLTTVS